jgi:hypothetical protein
MAASKGNLDVLREARTIGCPWGDTAATFPEVPTSMTATHAVQDLRGMFGDNVVKKEKFLATD